MRGAERHTWREDLGAGAVFGGEEGDDVAEDVVRKAADPVGDGEALFLLFQPPLLGSREHPHGGAASGFRDREIAAPACVALMLMVMNGWPRSGICDMFLAQSVISWAQSVLLM